MRIYAFSTHAADWGLQCRSLHKSFIVFGAMRQCALLLLSKCLRKATIAVLCSVSSGLSRSGRIRFRRSGGLIAVWQATLIVIGCGKTACRALLHSVSCKLGSSCPAAGRAATQCRRAVHMHSRVAATRLRGEGGARGNGTRGDGGRAMHCCSRPARRCCVCRLRGPRARQTARDTGGARQACASARLASPAPTARAGCAQVLRAPTDAACCTWLTALAMRSGQGVGRSCPRCG